MNGKWARTLLLVVAAVVARNGVAARATMPSTALCGAQIATIGLAPDALARVRLPEDALSALGRLHVAIADWKRSTDAVTDAPADEATRREHARYTPYENLFVAYEDFLVAARDVDAFVHWSEDERHDAARSGLDEELATTLETTKDRFLSKWTRVGRRFLDSPLGTDETTTTLPLFPIRLQFSDREVADFFERCRNANPRSVQSCAGTMPWARHARLALRRLELVNASASLDDIKRRTKELKHYSATCRYAGYYAIEIDHKYRLLFHWDFATGSAYDVFIENYHAE